MNQLPPLKALRAFEAAGRHLNFRAAADELLVTQGAVAQQVRLLEAHLGLLLFERQPRGLAFTTEGKRFHARIITLFADLKEAVDDIRPAPSRVVISVTPTFAAKWLIPNLPDFSKAHPDLELQILATEKVSNFGRDGVDLAVRQGQPPFGTGLSATHLFSQTLIAVASPSLIKELSVPLSDAQLANLPKLHDGHDSWAAFSMLDADRKASNQGLRFSQTTLAIDAALSGQGVALVSQFLVERDLADGRLVKVSDRELQGTKDFYLVTTKSTKPAEKIGAVSQWIIARVSENLDRMMSEE